MVGRLQSTRQTECKQHPLVYRPWGSYEALVMAGHFQLKCIMVNPGQSFLSRCSTTAPSTGRLSSGTAELANDRETRLYTENRSTYIPLGIRHRLKNPASSPSCLLKSSLARTWARTILCALPMCTGAKTHRRTATKADKSVW